MPSDLNDRHLGVSPLQSSSSPPINEGPISLGPIATVVLSTLLLALTVVAGGRPARQDSVHLSTPEEFKAEFATVPCRNEDRMAAVQALFRKLGAIDAAMTIDHHKDVDNLIVRKDGTDTDTIVIGAHYDKVSAGCGAVDNWTGIVAVARAYASLKEAPLRKTVLFVAFGKEERGLVGSRAMVSAIDKEQSKHYCAMINIDSLGLTTPQIMDNASSNKLTKLAGNLAETMKIPFSHAILGGADADSTSFVRHGIPAVTIHGLNPNWKSILHTTYDQPQRINAQDVYQGYRLALAMLARVDAADCGAFR